jgi:signal transduction histidine kinase
VLLVEDDEDDYVLTRDLLREIDGERFELQWRATFEDGAAAIESEDFDVSLFDYRLGGRTGLELLEVSRTLRPTTPVILLTGQGDLEVDIAAMRSGAADYLLKDGLDAAQLERSIRYSIQHRRVEEERVRRVREEEGRIQAEAANRAKDEFLATVSHELRTPLNAVLGWVTLLRMGKLDPAAAERALDVVERNAKAQVQIIDDLLDQARIVSNTLRLEMAGIDLAAVLERALESAQPEAAAKQIHLSLAVETAPVRLSGDAGRLQQVVSNLLNNALKFTPDGGTVQATLKVEDGFAVIDVTDSGPGIPPEALARIFDRFQQGEGLTGKRKGGLGLGLAIARHLVEAHGGTLQAASPGEGGGATFTVRLPLASA